MKKVFMSMCIVSITASCHAMLRTVGQLQRATHIAAQAATLGKRSMCFDSNMQAAIRPIYHKCNGEYMRLEILLKNAQHNVNLKKQELEKTEVDYQKLKNQHYQATEQFRIEYSQMEQLLYDSRDLTGILPQQRTDKLMRLDEYMRLEALLESAQHNVNLRKQELQKTELIYYKFLNRCSQAEKKLDDAIRLKNFAHSLDGYYDKLQACFEYHDDKNAAKYRGEITQDLAALIEQIEPEHDDLMQENMQPVGC